MAKQRIFPKLSSNPRTFIDFLSCAQYNVEHQKSAERNQCKRVIFVARKVKVQKISNWSTVLTAALMCVCLVVSLWGYGKYQVLRSATQDYISSEAAAQLLRNGSDFLTRQVRFAAITGEQQYIDAYFEEANVTRSRERALDELDSLHGERETMAPLQEALNASLALMQTEFYSMRLIEEAAHTDSAAWPEELKAVTLSDADAALSDEGKKAKARELVTDAAYEEAKDEIYTDVNLALDALSNEILGRQYQAADAFSGALQLLLFCIALFAVMLLMVAQVMRIWIVKPLLSYTKSIQTGPISPICGVNELQVLAETYNAVYAENEEREALMKHQAEYDPLTQLLNRGSYDRILDLYLKDKSSFALILVDVDTFKQVNDTYGHAVGDLILKKVAKCLRDIFRTIDYVCRIGGDEFAVIMVDMTSDLSYTILDKIEEINKRLAIAEEGVPAVSLSVGAAFTDRVGETMPLFKAADAALYYTREHGRSGCTIYPAAGNN